MSRPASSGNSDLMSGYRRLAMRVIERAFRDLDCPSPDLRRSARAFLNGHPLLFLWCDLAEIRAARVIARATEALPLCPPHDTPAGGPAQASAGDMPKLATARASVS
jgi:hypothetical protein